MLWIPLHFLKKSLLIIAKSDSAGLSKLSSQTKKVKLRKTLGNGQRTSLSYLQKPYLIRKITFAISLEKLALKKSAASVSKILLRWKCITKFPNRITLTK